MTGQEPSHGATSRTADMAVYVLSARLVPLTDTFAWHSRMPALMPALTARTRVSIWVVAPVGPSIVSRVDVRARPSCCWNFLKPLIEPYRDRRRPNSLNQATAAWA